MLLLILITPTALGVCACANGEDCVHRDADDNGRCDTVMQSLPTPATFTEMPMTTKNAIFVTLSLQIAVIYTVMLMITRGVTAAELSIRTPVIYTEMQTIITSVTIAKQNTVMG